MSNIQRTFSEVDGGELHRDCAKPTKIPQGFTPLKNVTQTTQSLDGSDTTLYLGQFKEDVIVVECHGEAIDVSLANAFNRTYKLVFIGTNADTVVTFPAGLYIDQRPNDVPFSIKVNEGSCRTIDITVSKSGDNPTMIGYTSTTLTTEWPHSGEQVKFNDSLFQDEYDRLLPKDANTVYFIRDTRRIYKGAQLFSASGGIVYNFSDTIGGWMVSGSDGSLFEHTNGDVVLSIDDKILKTIPPRRVTVAKPAFDVKINDWTVLFDKTVDNLGLMYPKVTIDTVGAAHPIDVMVSVLNGTDRVVLQDAVHGIFNIPLEGLGLETAANFKILAKWDPIDTDERGSSAPINNAIFSWGPYGGISTILDVNYDASTRGVSVTGVDGAKIASFKTPVEVGASLQGDGSTSNPVKTRTISVSGDDRASWDAAFADVSPGEAVFANVILPNMTIVGLVSKDSKEPAGYQMSGMTTIGEDPTKQAVAYEGTMPSEYSYAVWSRIEASMKQVIIPPTNAKAAWVQSIVLQQIKSNEIFLIKDATGSGLTGFGRAVGPRNSGGLDYSFSFFAMNEDGSGLYTAFSDFDDPNDIVFNLANTLIHNELRDRNAADAHPMSSITGLLDSLSGTVDSVEFLPASVQDQILFKVQKTTLPGGSTPASHETIIKAVGDIGLAIDSTGITIDGSAKANKDFAVDAGSFVVADSTLSRIDNNTFGITTQKVSPENGSMNKQLTTLASPDLSIDKTTATGFAFSIPTKVDKAAVPIDADGKKSLVANVVVKQPEDDCVTFVETSVDVETAEASTNTYSIEATGGLSLDFDPATGEATIDASSKIDKTSIAKDSSGNRTIVANVDFSSNDRNDVTTTFTSSNVEVGEIVVDSITLATEGNLPLTFDANTSTAIIDGSTKLDADFASAVGDKILAEPTIVPNPNGNGITLKNTSLDVSTKSTSSTNVAITASSGLSMEAIVGPSGSVESINLNATGLVEDDIAAATDGMFTGSAKFKQTDGEVSFVETALAVVDGSPITTRTTIGVSGGLGLDVAPANADGSVASLVFNAVNLLPKSAVGSGNVVTETEFMHGLTQYAYDQPINSAIERLFYRAKTLNLLSGVENTYDVPITGVNGIKINVTPPTKNNDQAPITSLELDGTAFVQKSVYPENLAGLGAELLYGATKYAVDQATDSGDDRLFFRTGTTNVVDGTTKVIDVPISATGGTVLSHTTDDDGNVSSIEINSPTTTYSVVAGERATVDTETAPDGSMTFTVTPDPLPEYLDPKYTVGKVYEVVVQTGGTVASATINHGYDTENLVVHVMRKVNDDEENTEAFGIYNDMPSMTGFAGIEIPKNDLNNVIVKFNKDANMEIRWLVLVKAAPPIESPILQAI